MKRAYGYTRTAIRETSNIQLQQMRIKDYCKENKIKLVEIFDDNGMSGLRTFRNRGLDEMLSKCRKIDKIDAIIVTDMERFSRNGEDRLLVKKLFERKGIELITLNYPNKIGSPEADLIDEIIDAVRAVEGSLEKNKQKFL